MSLHSSARVVLYCRLCHRSFFRGVIRGSSSSYEGAERSDANQGFCVTKGESATVQPAKREPRATLKRADERYFKHLWKQRGARLVPEGWKNDPYEDIPILRPTASQDDPDDELSEGARLWLADLIHRAEKGIIDPSKELERDPQESDEVDTYLETARVTLPLPETGDVDEANILEKPIPMPPVRRKITMKPRTASAIVSRSDTLQKLVELGVDLAHLENKWNALDIIVKLNFERDIQPYLSFLGKKCSLPFDKMGHYLTRNPWILHQHLDDLQVRLNYLESKRFSQEAIASIVSKGIYWLNMDVKTADGRIGWWQKEFALTGDEVRSLVTRVPKLVTSGIGYAQTLEFTFHEEFGFTVEQIKELLLKDPKLFLRGRRSLVTTFEYLHHVMDLSHERILQWPKVLRHSVFHLQPRYEFLKKLKINQFDRSLPNYIPLDHFAKLSDRQFVKRLAMTNLSEYNTFLKTL